MPHTVATRARAYLKMKARREEWLKANGPCRRCGSWDQLEADHVDPSGKVHHAVWSWELTRMLEELKKCQPLCHECHKKKTAAENSLRMRGKANSKCRTLTKDQVFTVLDFRSAGLSERKIATKMGITRMVVHRLLAGNTYLDWQSCERGS